MSNNITVFVITTGEESIDDCLEAINKQSFRKNENFEVKIISDVYPMSEAFNEMHRRCETDFFIQVDADVILKEDAVEVLYNGIKDKSFFTYASHAKLYEEGFGIGGSVRCWRKSFFKYFPFNDCRTVDRNLYKRSRPFFFRRKSIDKVVGIHRPRHSLFSEYLKTKSDVEKWRFLGRKPQKYALPLLEELLLDTQKEKYRIFGFILGVLTSKERVLKSKNNKIEINRLNNVLNELGINSLKELEIRSASFDKQLIHDLSESYRFNNNYDLKNVESLIKLFSNKENINIEKLLGEIRK